MVFLDLFLQFEPPLYILFKILLSRCTWLLCLMSIVSCSLSVGQVVLSIQKGAHLLTVFRQSRGICNDWSSSIAFLAAIFFMMLPWFWTQYFWSPFFFVSCAAYHLRRAYELISTISCQQGCIRNDCCFFGLLFSSGTFNVSYRALYPTLIIVLYLHIKNKVNLWVEMSPGHQN